MKANIGKQTGIRRHGHALMVVLATAVALFAVAGSAAAPQKAAAGAPVNTSPPTISGTPQVGQTLTSSNGAWTGTITKVTYAWWRCNASTAACTAIGGANGTSYKLVDADGGSTIRFAVTASNSSGSTTAASDPTSPVASKPVSAAPPTISGTPVVGQTLTTGGGQWNSSPSITSVKEEWERCDRSGNSCSAINGPTWRSYTLTSEDENHTIRVTETVTNSLGSSAAVSDPTLIVTAHGEPAYVSLPTISGTAAIGQTLSANGGKWSSVTSIRRVTYAWWRCDTSGHCVTIDGATDTKYKIVDADAGHTIRVAQTVADSAGSATAVSVPTAVVASGKAVATALPAISGAARVGAILSTSGAKWNSSTNITKAYYQWLRCDSNGNNCGSIPSATNASYRLVLADLGHRLRVMQTVDNGQGTSSSTSGPTGVVTSSGGTGGSIPATSVVLPNRLVISGVQFNPRILRSRSPFVARFRVTDTSGRPVVGALVYALGLPYAWVQRGIEVATDANGWATLTITPSRKMPIRGKHGLVMFVRARVPGQPVLQGSSVRRLVQVLIR